MNSSSFDSMAVASGINGRERHAFRNDGHGHFLLVLALPAIVNRFFWEGSWLLTHKELLFEGFFDRLDLMTSAEFAVVAGTWRAWLAWLWGATSIIWIEFIHASQSLSISILVVYHLQMEVLTWAQTIVLIEGIARLRHVFLKVAEARLPASKCCSCWQTYEGALVPELALLLCTDIIGRHSLIKVIQVDIDTAAI